MAIRRLFNSSTRERGNGSSGVIFFVGILCVAWFSFFAVTDWIYNTKESRVQADWERNLEKGRHGVNLIDRGPGDYQVECNPGFSPICS